MKDMRISGYGGSVCSGSFVTLVNSQRMISSFAPPNRRVRILGPVVASPASIVFFAHAELT